MQYSWGFRNKATLRMNKRGYRPHVIPACRNQSDGPSRLGIPYGASAITFMPVESDHVGNGQERFGTGPNCSDTKYFLALYFLGSGAREAHSLSCVNSPWSTDRKFSISVSLYSIRCQSIGFEPNSLAIGFEFLAIGSIGGSRNFAHARPLVDWEAVFTGRTMDVILKVEAMPCSEKKASSYPFAIKLVGTVFIRTKASGALVMHI
jgi:hypothetical protein